MTELRVPRRFNGPPDSANGGYLGGLLAQRVDAAAVTVVLRSPPPLDTAMTVGGGQLLHDATLVAEFGPGELEDDAPQAVSYDRAVEAGQFYRSSDTFSSCFVCGSARADGLRIGPGPVLDDTVAAPWIPDDSLAVDTALLWAALDCPGAWSLPEMLVRPAVLGRMTAAVPDLPEVGEQCVTVGRLRGESGRKAFASTAVYGSDGRLLGRAEQVWIRLP
ncbi:hypothetical protein [Nocardia bovistercoris]|uniref:Thioesterase family protein n=1 Tax=Nocardia bovistercoris TaxID=2785916 RepID=A0A931I9Y9_9NOCA|nr:hypothetical protein [Nocardia bovistercoris]MBH0777459.1 hypothetical protein [Nocardia bovistercoris]